MFGLEICGCYLLLLLLEVLVFALILVFLHSLLVQSLVVRLLLEQIDLVAKAFLPLVLLELLILNYGSIRLYLLLEVADVAVCLVRLSH